MKDYKVEKVLYFIKIGENYLYDIHPKGVVEITKNIERAWSRDSSLELKEITKVINDMLSKLKETFNIDGKVEKVTSTTTVTYKYEEVDLPKSEEE